MIDKSSFIGTWQLKSFVLHYANGNLIYPYGETAIGYIIYTICDHMSVQIMRYKRDKCVMYDHRDATLTEKIEIADNYMGYSGKYRIMNNTNTIIHYPEVSSFPNLIGTRQKRKYTLVDNKLILVAKQPDNKFFSRLVWLMI